jgi:hypothetical protein
VTWPSIACRVSSHSNPYSNRYSNPVRTTPHPGGRLRTPRPCDLRKRHVGEHPRTPARGWGSRGRRFKSCQPDRAGQRRVVHHGRPAFDVSTATDTATRPEDSSGHQRSACSSRLGASRCSAGPTWHTRASSARYVGQPQLVGRGCSELPVDQSSCPGGPALRFRLRFLTRIDQLRCSEHSRATRSSPAAMPCSWTRRR